MLLMLLALIVSLGFCQEVEKVGVRPYELDWAGRLQDDRPPLVDFEDLDGWTVELSNSQATFERTREQQIWGKYVGKLTYRGLAGGGPEVTLRPPQPIAIDEPFDAVTLWAYGNNWGYAPNPATPQVNLTVLFRDAAGEEFGVYLYRVDWTEWYVLHRRLSPDQMTRIEGGAALTGIKVTGGRNKEDRVVYLDNLAVYAEQFEPLSFDPRPQRGIAMFPGQGVGTNTGPGTLPFPTRPETILPANSVKDFTTRLREAGEAFVFTYEGTDGTLTYRLEPRTGTFGDITAQWQGRGDTFRPCVEGGAWLVSAAGPVAPKAAEHLGTSRQDDTVQSRWRLSADEALSEVTYTYRLWAKSLVIDVVATGGQVAEVRYGHAEGLNNPRLVTNPFYPASRGRPAVAVSGPAEAPLFLTGNTDWCLSNASEPWAANNIDDGAVTYNGGTAYTPKTDGRRNDCYDRLFLTVSPRYEEMLPVIPNPPSPWKHITGTKLWRAHGAGNREHDAAYWRKCHRYGMTQVVITDHETGWRDGGESFTFRTRPAPGKGGDEGQFKYARIMQDELGFTYGPYNNYTDFAPVNEYWSTDLIARTPDNQLQHAWMRCYAPKPARAVEYCAKLAPIIQEKFHFSTAYCDVHTAVAPWHRVDYDARVPGAGSFAAVFYLYGEIMLHQKEAWNGPVYSEGNHHSFYSGLTDGNYGQDQPYRPAVNPWLVDFDLRRMHDLCCNFGMGSPNMFYARAEPPRTTREEMDAYLDRFFAATVAFGHPGFLTYEGGIGNAVRGYYMLQQLHSRYCLASAEDIRYANEEGELLDTSAAVATGAYKRSQVATRYSDGTCSAANGSPTERMTVQAFGRKLDLPPNGYAGWTEDGQIEVISGEIEGHRCDYAVTPAHIYVDGRGQMVRFAKAAGNGAGVCRVLPDGGYEIILLDGADCGFAIQASTAVALNEAGEPMGPASVRVSRGLTYVAPVDGAFSYELTDPTGDAPVGLTCHRDEVVAGEVVTVRGKQPHTVQIPTDAQAGQRIWRQLEGAWIDFTVVPLTDAQIALQGTALRLELSSNLDEEADFTVDALGRKAVKRLAPGAMAVVALELGAPTQESTEVIAITIHSGASTQLIERALRTLNTTEKMLDLPDTFRTGMCLRGGVEQAEFGDTGAHVRPQPYSCGDVTKPSIAMHPPWRDSVGYAFACYDDVTLPAQPAAAFRALAGKGDGSDPGDGILYKLVVVDAEGLTTSAGQVTVTTHEWTPLEADLTRWAGQTVSLKMVADPGPQDDTSGDWACWAETRVETLKPLLVRRLEQDVAKYRREPGPFPLDGLALKDIRDARRGWLHYDGQGLSGTGDTYGSFAVLNGIELGNMAPASGSETENVWAENVSVDLTPEAIAVLQAINRFVLKNPGRDYFKVRRFWVELELADGRKCSSQVSTAAYTQPPGWPYGEGILIPHGQDIEVEVLFLLDE